MGRSGKQKGGEIIDLTEHMDGHFGSGEEEEGGDNFEIVESEGGATDLNKVFFVLAVVVLSPMLVTLGILEALTRGLYYLTFSWWIEGDESSEEDVVDVDSAWGAVTVECYVGSCNKEAELDDFHPPYEPRAEGWRSFEYEDGPLGKEIRFFCPDHAPYWE